jgi:class 3 adenylate cyclase
MRADDDHESPSHGLTQQPRANEISTNAPQPVPVYKYLIFGDLHRFSVLPEENYLTFFRVFQKQILDDTIQTLGRPPSFGNTWGDGFHFIFDAVVPCADFALQVIDRTAAVDWQALGLPAQTNVRIGLNAGLVYKWRDPITGRYSYLGQPITLAARIEATAHPGCAYASERFVGHLEAAVKHNIRSHRLGLTKLAKGYGKCYLYELRREKTTSGISPT